MPDESKLVAKFDKSATEEVRISIDLFKGKRLVNIRTWYKSNEQWLPGKQGIALSVDKFEALMTGLTAAREQLKEDPK